jgi:EmrB/QacA subfamily drug resistance transporter
MGIASVVVVGTVMSILDTTIVNVALRTLGDDFHSPLSTIQWVATGYMLSLATVIPLTGWAAERFGAWRVWMTSIVLFLIGSALSGAAWSAGSLIFFRVLQGFGGGMIMPIGMTILAQAAGPQRMGRVMGIIGVPMLMGPILGPVLGGVLVEYVSWRWIFFVNIPIGIVGLFMAARLLPRDEPQHGERLDLLGFLLLSPGIAGVVYGLAEIASKGGIESAAPAVSLVAGLLLVTAFVIHALRVERPLLDMRLFRNMRFSAASATTVTLAGALFGGMILIPLYFQQARGEGALAAGLLMAPQGVGAAAVMPVAGWLTDKVSPGRVVIPGLVCVIIGTLPFTQLTDHSSYLLLSVAMVIRGVGIGATMMPAMSAAYQTLSRAAVPRATSSLNVLQRVGGSLGTAILAVVLEHRLIAELKSAPSPAQAPEALSHAYGQTFWVALGMSAIALIPALRLVPKPEPAETIPEEHLPTGPGALTEVPETVG